MIEPGDQLIKIANILGPFEPLEHLKKEANDYLDQIESNTEVGESLKDMFNISSKEVVKILE